MARKVWLSKLGDGMVLWALIWLFVTPILLCPDDIRRGQHVLHGIVGVLGSPIASTPFYRILGIISVVGHALLAVQLM